ncbi:MAG: hypothetical protein GY856_49770 [bacterium]|nr:hypothetical protein [bacterium]
MKKLLSGIVVICSVAVVGCGLAPPLRVTQHDNEVEINVMTLGEYFTSIKTIRLTVMPTSEVVWELIADSLIPQIWTFTLSEGSNSVYVEGVNTEHYRVVAPNEATVFHLERDREYMIEVCDHTGRYCATEQFKFLD